MVLISIAFSKEVTEVGHAPHKQQCIHSLCVIFLSQRCKVLPGRYDPGGEQLRFTLIVFEIRNITTIPFKKSFQNFVYWQNIEANNSSKSSTLSWSRGPEQLWELSSLRCGTIRISAICRSYLYRKIT